MSSSNPSGEGRDEGQGGWAAALNDEEPDQVEVREEVEAQEEGPARAEGDAGTRVGGTEGVPGGRGASPRRDQAPSARGTADEGHGDGRDRGRPSLFNEGESLLETPRGREALQDFLAQLARQPSQSKVPSGGESRAPDGTAGVPIVTPSTTLGRPSLMPIVGPGGGSAPGGRSSSGAGVTAGSGPSTFGVRPTAPVLSSDSQDPAVNASEETTREAGTPMPNQDLQAFLLDTMSQALRAYATSSGSSTPVVPSAAVAATTRPLSAPYVYERTVPTQPVSAPRLATPGVAPQASVSPPAGMPMAAIPSYGGVSIQVPSSSAASPTVGSLPPGAFYPPFQPQMMASSGWGTPAAPLPAWSAAGVGQTPTPVNASWGSAGTAMPNATPSNPVSSTWGLGPQSAPSVSYVPSTSAAFPAQQGGVSSYGAGPLPTQFATPGLAANVNYGVPPAVNPAARAYPTIGIPTELRNAVKVIVPFYSDSATSERAAAFWRSFEKCTNGMDGQMRLTAFEQCLKGKVGQEWWYNSRIDSFEALRVRFHNRFICQTPAQLWSRLKAAKRNRGESAEEWGDRISTICEALNYNEPRMRYEFFLDGLRNKQMRAMLNSSMVTSIPEACALLLYKNLHLPVEEEDEFQDEVSKPEAKAEATTQSQMLQQLQQLTQMMEQQRQGMPLLGHINAVASTPGTPVSPIAGNASSTYGPLKIRMGPDTRTTEGEIVCGRCQQRGCSRETCPRGRGRCNRCQELGHYSMECNRPRTQGNYRGGERRSPECFLCGEKGHTVAK